MHPVAMLTPAMKLYALTAAILSLQLLLLALWTGTVRTLRKTYVNPEDAKLNGAKHAESDHEDVLRVKRAHQNALENALPFFVVGLLYAMTEPTEKAAMIYFGVFGGVRLLHSVFYLWGRQPFRTICFATGVLATFGMAYRVISHAL